MSFCVHDKTKIQTLQILGCFGHGRPENAAHSGLLQILEVLRSSDHTLGFRHNATKTQTFTTDSISPSLRFTGGDCPIPLECGVYPTR